MSVEEIKGDIHMYSSVTTDLNKSRHYFQISAKKYNISRKRIGFNIMASNLEQIKKDLSKLILDGYRMLLALQAQQKGRPKSKKGGKGGSDKIDSVVDKLKPLEFGSNYEKWYSQSLEVIRQLLPNRLDDFVQLYKVGRRKDVEVTTYGISDYLIGLRVTRLGEEVFSSLAAAFSKFQQQFLILQSAEERFSSSLFDIKQVVQADLFDSELDAAGELNKKGFVRSAGALAGVVLEKHLAQVCVNHKLVIPKKKPTISDFNERLKNDGIIEIAIWRRIQHLGDVRNLCDHAGVREPQKEDVDDLIVGTDKVIKDLF